MPTRDELIRIIDELLEKKSPGTRLPPEFIASYKANLVHLLSRRIGVTLVEHMSDADAELYLQMVVQNDGGHATELLQRVLPNADKLVKDTVSSFLAEISYGKS